MAGWHVYFRCIMTTISANLQAVQTRMERALQAAERAPGAACLLAVSKTWPAVVLRQAHAAGQRAFGENYVQEALAKMADLSDLNIEWHFIGPLQSNKTREVAEHFAWVHGIDRLKIAQRLSAQRPAAQPPLQVCIQVNVSGEESKSGVTPAELPALAQAVAGLPKLQLRGLMTIPEPTTDAQQLRSRFRLLRELRDQLRDQLHDQLGDQPHDSPHSASLMLDTLSMGMSHDFELALAEGATIIRVGSAIFGSRPAHS